MNVFAGEDIAPEKASEGRAEGSTEGAEVDAEDHCVHGAPEGAVGDGVGIVAVDFLPCLHDAGEEDGGADVGAGKLVGLGGGVCLGFVGVNVHCTGRRTGSPFRRWLRRSPSSSPSGPIRGRIRAPIL